LVHSKRTPCGGVSKKIDGPSQLSRASTFIVLPAKAQQDQSSSQTSNDNTVEGTVVSGSRDTLVVRTDDDKFQLFTYDRDAVRARSLAPGARVRVTAGPADENGTRSASNVMVLTAASGGGTGEKDKGA